MVKRVIGKKWILKEENMWDEIWNYYFVVYRIGDFNDIIAWMLDLMLEGIFWCLNFFVMSLMFLGMLYNIFKFYFFY